MQPAASNPITGQPITDLVWAPCVTCGADALATPKRVAAAQCGPCHWKRAEFAAVPDTQPSAVFVHETATRGVQVPEPVEPARVVETDIRSVQSMRQVAEQEDWRVRVAGTYGNGTEMIGVWMDGHGYRAAAFWSRKYEVKVWKAAGTYLAGKPPVTAMNHTELKRWLRTRDPAIIHRARLRSMPVYTCESPFRTVVTRRATEHGG